MKKNLKKGFTLVELVIVIAVIAILSAVLIPTFGNVINNAKESSARSEASNAITQYVNNQAQAQNDTNIADGYVVVLDKRVTFGTTSNKVSFKKGDQVAEVDGKKINIAYIFECTKGAVGDEVKDTISNVYGVVYNEENGVYSGATAPGSGVIGNGDEQYGTFTFNTGDKTISTYGVYFLDANVESDGVSAKVIVIAKK